MPKKAPKPFKKRRPIKRVESHLEEKLLERLKTLVCCGVNADVPDLPLNLSVVRNYKPFLDRNNAMEMDFAWVGIKIGIEVHGGIDMRGRSGGHTSPEGLRRDYYKVNLAQTYGWILLQFNSDYCSSPEKATSQQEADWSVARRLIRAAFKLRGVKVE